MPLPNWLNDFITAGAGEMMNQQQFVQQMKDQQSINQQNSFNTNMVNDTDGKANAIGVNDQSGESFEVVVEQKKGLKDKGLQVEFSSAKGGKYVCAALEDFCDGRYSYMSNLPLRNVPQHIANEIAKDCVYVANFITASIAGDSDSITLSTALDITSKIQHNSSINELDYKKIVSKLNMNDQEIYDTYLSHSKISIAKPISDINYYINYIKNFKEYQVAAENMDKNAINSLRTRISSVEKFRVISSELLVEFVKDPILRTIDKIGE